MGKQRHRDVKELACGHLAGTQKTKDPSGLVVTPEPHPHLLRDLMPPTSPHIGSMTNMSALSAPSILGLACATFFFFLPDLAHLFIH